jgi:hypothetical protein
LLTPKDTTTSWSGYPVYKFLQRVAADNTGEDQSHVVRGKTP